MEGYEGVETLVRGSSLKPALVAREGCVVGCGNTPSFIYSIMKDILERMKYVAA